MKEANLIKGISAVVLFVLWILFNWIHELVFGYPAWFLSMLIFFLAIYLLFTDKYQRRRK